MKKVLITGKNSYIGESIRDWLVMWPEKFQVSEVCVIGDAWRQNSFAGYDAVFHVAGIAHVSTDPKMEEEYYRVNRDLAIEVAKQAKTDGVQQFIFMSSIIVYGEVKEGEITSDTIPNPENFYGKSKLQAEDGILELEDETFGVVILRPPMVYGKGSKGNYQKLAKLARHTPVFPNYNNKRSMIHLKNLCEFVRLILENKERGIFYPQDLEYVKTSDMVFQIGAIHKKKILLFKWFNPLIDLLKSRVVTVNKVFGDLYYSKNLSYYKDQYQILDLKTALIETEGGVENETETE